MTEAKPPPGENSDTLRELQEAPDAVRRQGASAARIAELVARLRAKPPQFVVTCARGSSAHAATFGKHLIERHLGIVVVEAAPNIATVYGRRLRLEGQLVLTISQSGRSDDLVEFTAMAKSAGALTVAIVNDEESPVAAASDITLPMAAGPELSVAATKSFVTALAMLCRVVAEWGGDRRMRDAIGRLPERLAAATVVDWTAALAACADATSLTTIGRGPTLPMAREAALKFKETCELHAEAFSGAEFQHGPMALVAPRYPILMFAPGDEAAAGIAALAADLRGKGAALYCTGDNLPVLPPDQPDLDALCLIQSFYSLVIATAARRGTDVNRPRHLQKVTRTR